VVVDGTNPYWSLYILYHRDPNKIRNYFLYITIKFLKQREIFVVVGDFFVLIKVPLLFTAANPVKDISTARSPAPAFEEFARALEFPFRKLSSDGRF
jgi:hypothetical protein